MGLVEIDPVISVILGFVIGIASGFLVKYFQDLYLRPVLAIEGIIVTRQINLNPGNMTVVPYIANRIRIVNSGRSAAKNCKAYVVYREDAAERTGWMLPDNEIARTITLNVGDREFLDLCAISGDGQTRLVTLEAGYSQGTVESCTRLPAGNLDIAVRITSSNGNPTERRVRLHTEMDRFLNQHGRIIEFIS